MKHLSRELKDGKRTCTEFLVVAIIEQYNTTFRSQVFPFYDTR